MYEVNAYYQEKYKIIDKKETVFKGQKALVLDIDSEVKECKCPQCGTLCKTSNIGTYFRDVEDVPYNFESIWLHIHVHKYICTNEMCPKKYFDEILPFARKNKVKTDNFIQFILTLSIFLSSTATSLILSLLGTTTSADVVDNIIKKIVIRDPVDIEQIGVDDVAIRKGQTYATAIYDLNDHHLITLLDGRDATSFENWLKKHPKVKTIARDRASAYAVAINKVLPECIQVADRFHLFQNLIEQLKEVFYSQLPEKIFIKDGKILEEPVKKVAKELRNIDMNQLNSFHYDNTIPIDENGNEIKFDNKRRDFDSKQYQEQKQRRIEKKEKIIELRKRLEYSNCHETKELAKEFRISYASLLKYSKMTEEEVECIDKINEYKKSKSKMDDYSNMIYKMLKDGVSQEYIFAYVKLKGCEASDRYLLDYINLVAKNNGFDYKNRITFVKMEYPSDVTVITRYDLLKYLLTLDEKKEKDLKIKENIDIIYEKYPIAKQIQIIFKDFHDVIFGAVPDNLDVFIELYQDTVPTFCNGLKKDIAPVKNAISLEINSGFVEGNNNKFKLIKRIVYGKSKLCNLLRRSFIGFMSTLDDFDISIMVEDILNS